MSDEHEYSHAEALSMARRFDLIAAMPTSFRGSAPQMRQGRPSLQILAYTNGTMTAPEKAKGLPESAFAHDSAGRRIIVREFDMNLMNPADPSWRRQAVAQCVERMHVGHYDGCLVDNLTLGIFANSGKYVTAMPVAPGTRTVLSEGAYRSELTALISSFQSSLPGIPLIGNSIENAYRYCCGAVSSEPLAMAQRGVQMEDFLRGSKDGVDDFPGGADWLHNVEVISSLESAGKTALFTTKLWVPANELQVAQWQRYSMATFLLAANGHSYLAFTSSRDKTGAMGTANPYRLPDGLGSPLDSMTELSEGAFTRKFTNGIVFVNPTATPVELDVPQGLSDLDGQSVDSLRLGPHDGEILLSGDALSSG